MLWYKSWLETRWRFLIGLALLSLSACSSVLAYPEVIKLLPLASQVEVSGEVGRRVLEAMELAREYRGYVWSQWFRQNMPQLWAIFAVLLGTGGLLSQAAGGGQLFTLSLPVTRSRLLGVRAATGLAQLLVLAVLPSLVVPVLSPAIGQSYSVADALIHSACIFIAGSVFFSMAFLLSTVFNDVWRPLLIVLCVAVVVAILDQLFDGISRYSVVGVMTAENYFRAGGLPWPGLLVSAALSMAMLFAATKNIARHDF